MQRNLHVLNLLSIFITLILNTAAFFLAYNDDNIVKKSLSFDYIYFKDPMNEKPWTSEHTLYMLFISLSPFFSGISFIFKSP